MDISTKFSKAVIKQIRDDIDEADGNEVFFAGFVNEDNLIVSVIAAARGNEYSVPVNVSESRKCSVLIHNHPSGVLKPSDADIVIAENAAADGKGFYIINNDCSDVYIVVEPVKAFKKKLLDIDKVASHISSGGSLDLQSKVFEERPSQINLLKAVCETFNEDKIGVFEAGTGVGKSYAYLIPSIYWSVQNHEKVVISTGTINLQQQLIEKDIPAAQNIVGKKIKAVLLKGRNNYICLRRLNDALNDMELFEDDNDSLEKIEKWSKKTKNGSRSDLAFTVEETLWSRINSESDACMGLRCPYHDRCFVVKVRKEAADANILVVNHHLLFADIESRLGGVSFDDTAVLPPYHRVVFDEAHGIEDSATSFFSQRLIRFYVLKQLNLLYRVRKGGSAGYLFTVMALSSREESKDEIPSMIESIKDAFTSLENAALTLMEKDSALRLCTESAEKFNLIFDNLSNLRIKLSKFISIVQQTIDAISEDDMDIQSVWETKNVLRRLEESANIAGEFSEWESREDSVFWLQKVRVLPKKKGDAITYYVQFIKTPLSIASLMNEGVYGCLDSIACVSATLKIKDDFSFWTKRTGINLVEKAKVIEGEYESPFPYDTNVLFAIPRDAPLPNDEKFQEYAEDAIVKLVDAACGKTLVLFTSYDSLKHAYFAVSNILIDKGINVLKQGDDDRFHLLERFKKDTASVLFATDSFWEGVDVPGESLSQVIIMKLPFSVPNDPVFAARAEVVDKNGGSSFFELSVPQAVIKFRQGFGRLMRRSDDRGVIVVFDRRIVEKQYGKTFTQSVPAT
nr:DEAD/DEAH box helicase family protein [Treponema sp.]